MLGFLQFIVGGERTIFFCCFYVVWMTVFLETWKRKCSKKAYSWGSLALSNIEVPRSEFYGKLSYPQTHCWFKSNYSIYSGEIGKDPITGKMTPQYPTWKTLSQVYLVSVPVILCCTFIAGFMTVCQFWIEDALILRYSYESYILLLPSIFQSILVAALTVFYDRFATFLTEKENHRTQSQFERYRVIKLIVLEFVNNFFCLFYIAFIKQDMKMLQSQLMTQMIILQVGTIWKFLRKFLKFLTLNSSLKAQRNFCCQRWNRNIIYGAATVKEFPARTTRKTTAKRILTTWTSKNSLRMIPVSCRWGVIANLFVFL